MNIKQALFAAAVTGCFCAIFAFAIAAFGMLFASWPGVVLAFISGFLGSLFASLVLRTRP